MADTAKGETQTYSIKSGQGFLIFPGQITTYIADQNLPWEYVWIEFDGLRVKEAIDLTELSVNTPVYHSHSKDLREQLMNEMLYIVHHAKESPFISSDIFISFWITLPSLRNQQNWYKAAK